MGRHAKDTPTNFHPAPVGTHIARAIKIVDIGTQHGEYQGKPNARNQFILFWELPTEMLDTEDGQRPFIISKFYTNSLNEKATLRADLVSWRGKEFSPEELGDFDLMNILGKPCLVTVIEGEEKDKRKVSSVTGLPKGTVCPAQVNENFSFFIDEWDSTKFEGLSDGLKKMIEKSDEYKAMKNGEATVVESQVPKDDDLPF